MAGPPDPPRPSRRRAGSRADGSARPAAPRSRLPPRHRRPSKGWYSIGPILVVALLVVGKRWLRSQRDASRDTAPLTAERFEELVDQAVLRAAEVTAAEKRLLVDAEALAKYGKYEPSPTLGEYEKVKNAGGAILTYSYGGGEDPLAFGVQSCLVVMADEESAAETYDGLLKEAREATLDLGRVEFEPIPYRVGDASHATTIRIEGELAGNTFLCRKRKHVFFFACTGITLETEALKELLAPYLERFTTWDG